MRPGGVQALVMNIYRHIDRCQIQFDFAVRTQKPEHYDEEIKSLDGRLFHLPWMAGNPLSVIAFTPALENVLHNHGPFVALHSHSGLYSGHILPVGKKVNVPLRIAHSHSAALDKSSSLRRLWSMVMRQRIKASATHMLACSAAASKWLYGAEWQQDNRVLLFPNAIDLVPFSEIPHDRKLLRGKLRLPLEGPLIGHIGRFDPVKNHTFLLEIFDAFVELFPEAKLILVGEGKLRQKIEWEVVERGIENSVCFLGVRSDVPQILGALDLFVLPSLHEGLGIVLIEAQAAGVPCLASDAVPTEVDLGLGLVQFKSLDVSTNEWVQALRVWKSYKSPSWNERKATLQNAGYDIQESVKLLQNLYLSKV
jgi:glycosyltransferase involved in cell wall biosynthesis